MNSNKVVEKPFSVKGGQVTDENLYKAAIERAANAMMIVDGDNRIIFINEALSNMIECQKDAIVGRPCSEVFACNSSRAMDTRNHCLGNWSKGLTASQTQCNFIDKRGNKVPLCMIHMSIALPYESVSYKVVTVLDTLAKKQQDGITEETIAIASHELLSPLNLIRGYATTVAELDESLTSEERRRYLRGIESNVTRAAQTIRNFLEIPRLEAESLFLTMQPTSVADLLRRVVTEVQNQSTDHVIALRAPRRLPLVTMDRNKIERVVINLLVNALKYSPSGSDIIVTARQVINKFEGSQIIGDDSAIEVPCICIAVKDSGIGLPEDEIKLVFEKYYRANNTRSRAVSGAGIGLYLCKVFVEAHRGRIWARSRIGEGSIFAFTLPLIEPVTEDNFGLEHTIIQNNEAISSLRQPRMSVT